MAKPPIAAVPTVAVPPIPIPIPPNIKTLQAFLDALAADPPSLSGVMATFTSNNPTVGITSYGPQFIGYTAVQKLFRQIFAAFPTFTFAQQGPNSNWLFNYSGSMIGMQVNLSGLQEGAWFAPGTPYYSPPLSTIVPDSQHSMDLDACAIFYFDATNKISQLSIYFDRYLMAQQLATNSKA